MALNIDDVFGDYNVPGVPASGKKKVNKAEVRRVLKQIAGGTAAVGDYRGPFDSGEDYVATDLVEDGGAIWYAKVDSSGVIPVEGATWTLFMPGATVADNSLPEAKLAGALALTLPKACYSIAELQAVNTSRYHVACLALAGRDGMFTWVADASAALMSANIASSAVNSTTETITSVAHGLVTGQAVLASSAVNGLSANTIYYAIRVDTDNFRLSSTFLGAKAGTAFNLTGTSAMSVRRHHDPRMGIYVTPSSDLSGASGAWVRQHNSPFNAKWWDLKGTGATDDDTHALQAAIFYTENASLRELIIPAANVSAYHMVTASLVVTKPIRIVGEHMMVTIGGVGLASGRYVFEFEGDVFPNLEQVGIERLTIRPNISGTTTGSGIKFNRAANILMRDVIIFGGVTGILFTGNRSYGNLFENVHTTGVTGKAVVYDAFTGGGQHNWIACAISGAVGIEVTATCELSSLSLSGTAFEGCGQPIEINGTVHGLSLNDAYFEKNGSAAGASVRLIPSTGKAIRAFKASGGYYETDAEDYPFLIGGDGTVTSYEISSIETEGYGVALVRKNGAGTVADGQIRTCYLQNMAAVVSNGPLTRTAIENNGNASGAVTT